MSQSQELFAGKFQLVRLLGRGAMGEVWLANEVGPRNFQRQVALKRLLVTEGLSEYARESFVAEAQVIARLDHPNIVRLIELGESDDRGLYLVLDFIDGAALDRIIRRGPLSEAAVALIGREVAKALDAVHTMCDDSGNNLGVVHRDISPANILVGRDGRVRLSDFGVARIHGLGGEKTETGVFKGKLPYMPPEQATGAPFDGRADIFSLGITLFEGLIGGRLRRAETQGQLIAMIATERPPRVLDVAPRTSVELAMSIDRATEFVADARTPTAGHLAAQLHATLHQMGPHAEEHAINELMERVASLSGAAAGPASRTPWSLALSGENAAFGTTGPRSSRGPITGSHALGVPQPSPSVQTTPSSPSSGRRDPISVPPDAQAVASVTRIASIREVHTPQPAPRSSRAVFFAICAALVSGSLLGAVYILFLAPTSPASVTEDTAAPAKPTDAPASATTATADARPTATTDAPVEPTAEETASAVVKNPKVAPTTPRTAQAKASAVEEVGTGNGTLQVAVNPWGNVSINGKSYGTTPLGAISLPPGSYTVTVTNPDLGATRSGTVKVSPGKPASIRFDLKKSE